MTRIILFVLIFVFIFSPSHIWATDQDTKNTTLKLDEITQLRIEKQVSDTMEKYKTSIDQRLANELIEHRKYLSELDDRFFERFSFWIPIVTASATILFALFLWQFGRTRKEAFENAQSIAASKAIKLAQQKVDSIIIPENIIKQLDEMAENAKEKINNLISALVESGQKELKETKDHIVKNKQDVIEQTLNEAIKEKFSKELDVVSRVNSVENELQALHKNMQIQFAEYRDFQHYFKRFIYELKDERSYMSTGALNKLVRFISRSIMS